MLSYIAPTVDVKKEFHTEWALVTGAGSGLGREITLRLADQGVNIIATGRNKEKLDAIENECKTRGVKLVPVEVDHSDPASISKVMESCEDKDVGVCIINAGLGTSELLNDVSDEKIISFVHLMCDQYTILAKEFIARNKTREHKSLIYATASLAAEFVFPMWTLYFSVKAYVSRMMKHLAIETSGTNIVCTAMHPGSFQSSFDKQLPEWMSILFRSDLLSPRSESVADAVLRTIGRTDRADHSLQSLITRSLFWAMGEVPQYFILRCLFMLLPKRKKQLT